MEKSLHWILFKRKTNSGERSRRRKTSAFMSLGWMNVRLELKLSQSDLDSEHYLIQRWYHTHWAIEFIFYLVFILFFFSKWLIIRTYKGSDAVVGVYRGVIPALMVLDPDLIKSIMITNFNNFRNQPELFGSFDKEADPLAGRNPFFLKDDEWKEKRNEIIPAFTSGRVRIFFIFNFFTLISCF